MATVTNFGYVYELILGIPEQINNFVIPQTIVSPFKVNQGTNGASPDGVVLKNGDYLDYNTIPAKAWSIKGFGGKGIQIKARIEQAKETGMATMIELINADPDIINQLRKDCTVILRAGYKPISDTYIQASVGVGRESVPDIFVGQIVDINTEDSDVDRVTKIYCGEGVTIQRNSRVSKSFPPQTTRRQVINGLITLLKEQGMPLGRFAPPPSDSKESKVLDSPYWSGYSCQGYLLSELEKICTACNLRMFTSVGKLYIEPTRITKEVAIPLKPVNTTTPYSFPVYTVKPSNVKGKVNKRDSGTDNQPSNADGKATKLGITLTTYLNGLISVDKIMVLSEFKDKELNGEYKIVSVSHVLDYRGGVWETRVSLESL